MAKDTSVYSSPLVERNASREMSELYRSNNVIGFQTYGEQYRSMHVNQTLTGVAIGKRRAAP